MAAELRTGDLVGGRYRVLGPLGSGGMAAVFLAHDVQLDFDVALKVLPARVATDETFVARFRREARMLARLNHPHIMRFYVSGEDTRTNLYYLVLEHLTGGTLRDRLNGLPWPIADALDLLRPIADALDYAHQLQPAVIHRDLKPANILFDARGRVVVADFGLARLVTPTPEQHHELYPSLTINQILGTPAYMAPEQAEGRAATVVVDVYALGVLAYELLTGRVPFVADTPFATLILAASRPVPPPRSINPALSDETEGVLLRALAKSPAERYPSAGAFVHALEPRAKPSDSVSGTTDADATIQRPPAAEQPTLEAPRAAAREPRPRVVLTVLATALAAGVLAAVAWLSAGGGLPSTASGPAPTAGQPAEATATPEASRPAPPPATPTPAPLAALTPVPAATPSRWQQVLAQLETVWGNDWPAAIKLLDELGIDQQSEPEQRDKLEAALVAYAGALLDDDRAEAAAAQLERARSVNPRSIAEAMLQALTPTSTPTAEPTATPTLRTAPATFRPVPTARLVEPPRIAVPTKIPPPGALPTPTKIGPPRQ